MIRFIVRRSLWAAFVLIVVITGVYNLVHVVGDPAVATLGERARPEQLEAFREKHGLNRPLLERYADYVGGRLRDHFPWDLDASFGPLDENASIYDTAKGPSGAYENLIVDDPAFREEYEFMRRRFRPQPGVDPGASRGDTGAAWRRPRT